MERVGEVPAVGSHLESSAAVRGEAVAEPKTIGELFASVGGWMNGGELGYPSFGSMEALKIYTQRAIRAAISARAALKAQPAPTKAQGGFLVRVKPTDPEYTDMHPQLALEDALRVNPYGWPDGFQFEIVAAQGEDSARPDGEIANGGA